MKDVQLISSPPSRDNLIYFLNQNIIWMNWFLFFLHNLPTQQCKFRRPCCLLEDMAIVPTPIYHWKLNLEKKLQTLQDTLIFEG